MIAALVILSVIAIPIAITVITVDVHIFPSSRFIAISVAGPWCGLGMEIPGLRVMADG